jgi:hypothetical protein
MRHRSHRVALFGVLAGAPVVGACGGALFACENADECAGAGAGARCEPDGWCSVVDDACPSGRRYGEHSGDGKAGACVEDGGTSSDATTIAPTTTLDPSTSSTTVDPTSATLESTSPSGTDETSSSSDATTTPMAVCGNDIVEGAEECDGAPPPGTSCDDLGFAAGEVSCTECMLDSSECTGCGPDGCTFGPCALADPRGCPAGETCIDSLDGGMCTGECTTDEHCAHPDYETVCYMMPGAMSVCFATCENDGPCPPGMVCVPLTPAVCVFT